MKQAIKSGKRSALQRRKVLWRNQHTHTHTLTVIGHERTDETQGFEEESHECAGKWWTPSDRSSFTARDPCHQNREENLVSQLKSHWSRFFKSLKSCTAARALWFGRAPRWIHAVSFMEKNSFKWGLAAASEKATGGRRRKQQTCAHKLYWMHQHFPLNSVTSLPC